MIVINKEENTFREMLVTQGPSIFDIFPNQNLLNLCSSKIPCTNILLVSICSIKTILQYMCQHPL